MNEQPDIAGDAPRSRASNTSAWSLTLKILTWFGAFYSCLSVCLLIQQYLEFGWARPLSMLIETHQRFLELAFTPVEPTLSAAVQSLPWDMSLTSNWKVALTATLAYWMPLIVFIWGEGLRKEAAYGAVVGSFITLDSLTQFSGGGVENSEWWTLVMLTCGLFLSILGWTLAHLASRLRIGNETMQKTADDIAILLARVLWCYAPVLSALALVIGNAGLTA